jgi:hypothetical protein
VTVLDPEMAVVKPAQRLAPHPKFAPHANFEFSP